MSCCGELASENDTESHATNRSAGFVGRTLLKLIELYRLTAPARTPRCRYIPSCSAYAEEALRQHGVARGLWLSLRRLLRCQPFGSFGYDPVPAAVAKAPQSSSIGDS